MFGTPSIMVRDLHGRITSWNPGSERWYGWSKDQAVGKVSHSLLGTVFPQPLDEINDHLQEHGVWQGELIHRLKDGRLVRVKSTWELQPDDRNRPTVFEVNSEFRDCSARIVPLPLEKQKRAAAPLRSHLENVRSIANLLWRDRAWWMLPAISLITIYASAIRFLESVAIRFLE